MNKLPFKEGAPFTVEEVSAALGLTQASARVYCHRRVAAGEILRLKRNLYLRAPDLFALGERELFGLSNLMQTPSYVSFGSALSFLGLSTQIPQSVVEAADPVRSRVFEVSGVVFRFYFVSQERYFGFVRKDGLFIAEPEKALLDALSFQAFGRYRLDESSLNVKDLKSLRWALLEKWLKKYPPRVRNYVKEWRRVV